MNLPRNAKLEKVLPGGIAIYDVSEVLPTPPRPRFNTRPRGTKIVRVFFHHSGAYGKDGYEGAEKSMQFVMQTRNFGARAYHFWLSRKPDVDAEGNIVIYRLAKDEERCWHTGNLCNDNGVGVVWQGNLHPDHNGAPTAEQYKMAEALTDWLIERYELSLPDGLSFHAEAKKWGASKNKESCPGPYVKPWAIERRNRSETLAVGVTVQPSVIVPDDSPAIDSVDEDSTENVVEEPPTPPAQDPQPIVTAPIQVPVSNKIEKPVSPKKNWFQKTLGGWANNLFPKRTR